MKLSAVIPVFNGAPYIATAIESALAQEGVDLEVIVVDDGSTDGTPAILRSFGQQIRVVRQENRGLAAARKRGLNTRPSIETASGEGPGRRVRLGLDRVHVPFVSLLCRRRRREGRPPPFLLS